MPSHTWRQGLALALTLLLIGLGLSGCERRRDLRHPPIERVAREAQDGHRPGLTSGAVPRE